MVRSFSEKNATPRSFVWFWGTGGAGIRFTHRIAQEIALKNGASNVCLSIHEENAWSQKAKDAGFVVETISGPTSYKKRLFMVLYFPVRLFHFWRQLATFKPNVIILPMNFGLAWPLAILAKLKRIPLVYVVHDATPHPGEYSPRLLKFTQSRLIGMATKLVTLSNSVRANLMYLYPQITEKIPVIPLSSHMDRRNHAITPIGKPVIKFLFLGRLLKYKGLEVIAAAVKLLENRKNWQLTIAGHGSDLELLKNSISASSQIDLSYLRWLSEEEVDKLFSTHDVVLCPYLEASQSGVVSEAASYGVPSIVSSVGGLPEQIQNGAAGWICHPGSAEALATIMGAIMDGNADYNAKSLAALSLVPEHPGTTGWADIAEAAASTK